MPQPQSRSLRSYSRLYSDSRREPWLGKNGVAAHLADLLPCPPKCMRIELDGEVRNWQHYFIPHPYAATVSRIEDRRRKA